jgi:hypothetical protein
MSAGTAASDTRSRLLDTALKLFSEHGMEGTSLQMIADEGRVPVRGSARARSELASGVNRSGRGAPSGQRA